MNLPTLKPLTLLVAVAVLGRVVRRWMAGQRLAAWDGDL